MVHVLGGRVQGWCRRKRGNPLPNRARKGALDEQMRGSLEVAHAKWAEVAIWPLPRQKSISRHQPILSEQPSEEPTPRGSPGLPDELDKG